MQNPEKFRNKPVIPCCFWNSTGVIKKQASLLKVIVRYLKSINLQLNTLGCLDDGANESSTKRLMFQVLYFFHDFLQNAMQKILSIHFLIFFYKITKIKIKSFDCPTSIKSIKKNSTWNIKLLDDNSFAPSSKQASLIYCRLTDL